MSAIDARPGRQPGRAPKPEERFKRTLNASLNATERSSLHATLCLGKDCSVLKQVGTVSHSSVSRQTI